VRPPVLSKLLGKKLKPEPAFACAHLNARFMPDTCGGQFEDSLIKAFEKSGLAEVTGAVTVYAEVW